MKPYLLDTNMISHMVKGDVPALRARMRLTPPDVVFMSVITEAELRFGALKCGYRASLQGRLDEIFSLIESLPWTSEAAVNYAILRARMEPRGKVLSNMDMLIASHARAIGAVLVSKDGSFAMLEGDPPVEDWTS